MQYFIEHPIPCIITIGIAVAFVYFTFFDKPRGGKKGE